MKRAELAVLVFFGAGTLLTLGVSLPATYAALALFHDGGDGWGVALSVFALLVFEFGAVGAKLATLAIPRWSGRLTALTIGLLLVTTGANYAHGYDLSQAATATPTLAAVLRDPAGAVVATLAAAALFPALLFVFLSAFVARAEQLVRGRAVLARIRRIVARAQRVHRKQQRQVQVALVQTYQLQCQVDDLTQRAQELTVQLTQSQAQAERLAADNVSLAARLDGYLQHAPIPAPLLDTDSDVSTPPIRIPAYTSIERPRDGFVYLLRAENGTYKIGRARNVQQRLHDIAKFVPFRVELMHVIATPDMPRLESRLHRCFADRRVNGEWFALTDTDVDALLSYDAVPPEHFDDALECLSLAVNQPQVVGALPQPVEGLPDVVRLKDHEGLSFAQIGERLGISRQAAWQKYKEAKKP